MQRWVLRSFAVGVLTLAGVAFLTSSAQAQMVRPVAVQAFRPVQNVVPPFAQSPLQTAALRQWSANTAVIGRTYARLPPWFFGYNPYPPINLGPVYRYPIYPVYNYPYYPPYPTYPYYGSGYVNPYASPYGIAGVGGYVNPYGGY